MIEANPSSLVYGISGSGKTSLCRQNEDFIDGDEFLYMALSELMPETEQRAQVLAWKRLCRAYHPSEQEKKRIQQIREIYIGLFQKELTSSRRIILTSILDLPFTYAAFFGYTKGRYLLHLTDSGRTIDNDQTESDNSDLDSRSPLFRLDQGQFLSPELVFPTVLL